MSVQAQYTVTPKIGIGALTAGDASRTAPLQAATVMTAGASGSRIDRILVDAAGTTAATTVRFFVVPGIAGGTITSITFATTTATVTTASSHGLSTGNLVTVQGALPSAYNVTNASITVTGLTTFTYTMASTPTINASTVGAYAVTTATPSYSLWQELALAAATPSATVSGTTTGLGYSINTALLPLILPAGYSFRATIDSTQLVQAAQVDSLVANGTLSGVLTLGTSKFTVTAASTAAVAALQTTAGAAMLSLSATPYTPAVPSLLTLTSAGNISAVTFTVQGTDSTGAAVTEAITGPNNTTVYSTKTYASVTAIYVNAAVGTNTSVGIASSVYMPVQPTKITVTSAANLSAITFTIRGIAQDGTQLTESLTGPAAGATVTSANTYKAITYVSPSSSSATTSIGTPAVISTVNVFAQGGDF